MYQDKELTIRPIEKGNLPRLWELIYKEDAPEWKRWVHLISPTNQKPLMNS